MAVINMSSIIPKINAYAESSQGKRQMNKAVKNVVLSVGTKSVKHKPEEIAARFVEVMRGSAQSTQGAGSRGGALGESAIEAISSFTAGAPTVSEINGMSVITIPFNFEGNLHRDSLQPDKYGGIDNIVALLNNGYTAGGTVFGKWHGVDIYSLRQRSGSGFIQNAVRQFMDRYASEYNIIDIEISGEYE